MQPSFDELGIELLKYGYRKVVSFEIECKIDGAIRLGISPELLPVDDHFECPKCHARHPCSGILATGYSRRPLPLEPEFWSGTGHWSEIAEQEYQPPAPKPGLDGRARHCLESVRYRQGTGV